MAKVLLTGEHIMEMPKIKECRVNDCAYNMNGMCHALGITIGDMIHPHCDTFCYSSMKGGDMSTTGSVGACKVSDCKFNTQLECCSPNGICVGYAHDDVECLTFESK